MVLEQSEKPITFVLAIRSINRTIKGHASGPTLKKHGLTIARIDRSIEPLNSVMVRLTKEVFPEPHDPQMSVLMKFCRFLSRCDSSSLYAKASREHRIVTIFRH